VVVETFPAPCRHKWTEDEIEILDVALRDGKSWRDCIELLPRRTHKSIASHFVYRRNAAKPQHARSDDPDVQAFLDCAAKASTREELHRKFPHLTRFCINQRLLSHGVKLSSPTKFKSKNWSASEAEDEKQGHGHGKTAEELAEQLPLRSMTVISLRVYRLAMAATSVSQVFRPWTKQDDETLISRFASGRPIRELAEELGRPFQSVSNRL